MAVGQPKAGDAGELQQEGDERHVDREGDHPTKNSTAQQSIVSDGEHERTLDEIDAKTRATVSDPLASG